MINVIGLGYIGLPTALMMASHGVEVIATDYNKQLVDTLNAGHTTFKEDGLDELFQNALKAGIKFTTEYQKTDMYIVSVPTPYDKFSKKVDACYVVTAVKEVMKVCLKGATVVIESTVSPGTIDKFVRPIICFCRHDAMDVYEIIRICNMHPRVNILQPGPGVGGHCISVDPWFLVGDYPQLAKVIDESMKTNDSQPAFVLNRIYEIMEENNITDNRKVGLYGLTYKENVDDYRESPALQMLDAQERQSPTRLARPLCCYDPFLEEHKIAENQYNNFDEFLNDMDMIIVLIKHQHILDNEERLKGKVILDCCNMLHKIEKIYHI